MGAGTGGAHAGMFWKIRAPASWAVATGPDMPGTSSARPFAFEKPL
jgi:hypothetical protein